MKKKVGTSSKSMVMDKRGYLYEVNKDGNLNEYKLKKYKISSTFNCL